MPFEIFRRHQKKMLAFMAIFAMVAFTLDFSLFRGRAPGADNPFVVTLYDKPVFRERLDDDADAERQRANSFVGRLDRPARASRSSAATTPSRSSTR